MVILALLFPLAVLVLLLCMSLVEDRLNVAVQRMHRAAALTRKSQRHGRASSGDH